MQPSDVISFWFDEETKPWWFKKSDEFDNLVRTRLGLYYEAAREGRLTSWASSPEGILALILLLDQVPRNIHRGKPQAFATDGLALNYALEAIKLGFDRSLTQDERLFLYLPFEHSEDLARQDDGVRLMSELNLEDYTHYSKLHREIIARFGRFPHRNAILGRTSTDEEIEFLKQPGSSF